MILMTQISNKELIEKAKSVLKPRKIKHGSTVGDVGCALITDKGNVYLVSLLMLVVVWGSVLSIVLLRQWSHMANT
jgi:hypothetical protein